MKKLLLNSIVATVVISAFAIVFTPGYATTFKNSDVSSAPSGIPDSLMKIFKRACMDCHSDGGNMMAASKVNFSNWDNYSAKKQSHKANKICDMLSEERMPPAGWRKEHEKLIPTKKETETICKWAATLNTEK